MKQIISGIKYIHNNNIIHRDLKLTNIMVNFDNQYDKDNLNMMKAKVKIIDFGISRFLTKNQLAYTAAGTAIYADPLIAKKMAKLDNMDKKGYGKEVDIWSLGALCYEMLAGKLLFKADNIKELLNKLEKGFYIIPSNLSKEAISFLESMLKIDAKKRLNINELENHPFLHKNYHCITRSKTKNGDLIYHNKNDLKQMLISNRCDFVVDNQKNQNNQNNHNYQNIHNYQNNQYNQFNPNYQNNQNNQCNQNNQYNQNNQNLFNQENNKNKIKRKNNLAKINNYNQNYHTVNTPNNNYNNENKIKRNYTQNINDDFSKREPDACCTIQ